MSGSPLEINEVEQDEDGVYELHRMNAVAGKGPMEDFYEEPDYPDLSSYFLEFNLSYDEQIKMCRSYASYLSSLMPKKKRKKTEKSANSPKEYRGPSSSYYEQRLAKAQYDEVDNL